MFVSILKHTGLIVFCLVLFSLYVIYDYLYPRIEMFDGTLADYIKGRPQVEMEEAPFAYYNFAQALKSNKFEDLTRDDGSNDLLTLIYNTLPPGASDEQKDEAVFEVTRKLNYEPTKKFYTMESIEKDIKYFNRASNLEHFMWMNNNPNMETEKYQNL